MTTPFVPNSQIVPYVPSQHNVGDTGCTADLDSAYEAMFFDWGFNPKINYGAVGDGTTDDTAALTSWINDINAYTHPTGSGAWCVVPPGQYMISAPLPTITANGVRIMGAGWAQTAFQAGSVISATAAMAQTLAISGEGVVIDGMCIDAGALATVACEVTGSAFQCRNSHFRAVGGAAASVCLNLDVGATTAYLHNCIFNGGGTGVQVNATDMIMTGCKPKNADNSVVLLAGANGAILSGNHWTAGASNFNCVQLNGGPRNIGIFGNRFDNYVSSAIQISTGAGVTGSPSAAVNIHSNVFFSDVMTDARFPLIGIDTTSSTSSYGINISGNSSFCPVGANRPLYFIGAYTQAGAVSPNAAVIGTHGLVCSNNSVYVSAAVFGPGFTPTAARGNIYSVNGTTFTALPDQ